MQTATFQEGPADSVLIAIGQAQHAVVMVTAYGRDEIVQATTDLNLEGFLNKPVSPSTMLGFTMYACGQTVATEGRRIDRERGLLADSLEIS